MGLLGISGVAVLLLVAGLARAESTVATRTQPVATAHLDFQITIARALTLPTAQACLAQLERGRRSASASLPADRRPPPLAWKQRERERLAQHCTVAEP